MFKATSSQPFDVIIIGGGINGVAIARDASLRGLKGILFEKSDFGAGASSKTSKLVHGGVRYLEHFEFKLVRESLRERHLLLKNASHLVHSLPFVLPIFDSKPHAAWKINVGLSLYDLFSLAKDLPTHQMLTKKQVLAKCPELKEEGLDGGCLYSDAQMLDHRLVMENILAAERAGGHLHNYMPVVSLIQNVQNQVVGVCIKKSDSTIERVFGKLVVNATGAWSNHILNMGTENSIFQKAIKPSKGVHLVIPKIISEQGLILQAPQNGRVFFVLPWGEYSLLGTTDTFYEGNLDEVKVDTEDRAYLLAAYNHYFPSKKITESQIIASFAGLRPLIFPSQNVSPSDLSRQHQISQAKNGLISVYGGKYTTHRQIAEEVVDLIAKRLKGVSLLPCMTATIPLPGALGPFSFSECKDQLQAEGLAKEQAEHLVQYYGTASLRLLDLLKVNPAEREPLCADAPQLLVEVRYAISVEHAKTLEDWFFRRTWMAYAPGHGFSCLEKVAEKFACLLQWSESEKRVAIENYRKQFEEDKSVGLINS